MRKGFQKLAVLCALTAVLAGCGAAGAVGTIRKIPETYLTMSVGSSGGGWYIMGAGLNDGFESMIPGLKMTIVPGGGGSNPTLVDKGVSVQIGFTYLSNACAAAAGTGSYKAPHENLMALCSLNVKQYLNVNATKNSGFDSFEKIAAEKPKLKISVGPRGSGSEVMISRILEAYGITYKDIKDWGGSVQYLSTDNSFNALKDSQIDIAANCSVLGLPSLIETAASRELYFLPVGEKQGEYIAKYGFAYEPIPAGCYPNQKEPIPAAVDKVVLVINKNVPTDVVYNITKVLCENQAKWVSIHNSFKDFDLKAAPLAGIKLHPGAEQYYKEAGLM